MKNSTIDSERIRETAHDAVDKVEEKIVDSMERAREASSKIAEKASETEERIHDALSTASRSISDYVVEKPLQAAGFAFAAGVLATLILSRNKS